MVVCTRSGRTLSDRILPLLNIAHLPSSESLSPFPIQQYDPSVSTFLLLVLELPADEPRIRTIEVMYLAVQRSQDALFALAFFVGMTLVVFSTLL